MIDSLAYKTVSDSLFPWADSLDYFKYNPVTQFKPGLNILFGSNGSGKSTLLQMLGKSLAAVQGGTSTVTGAWLSDVFGLWDTTVRLPCKIVHDGQPIMFFDARAKEGLVGGSFDDDFFNLGLANTMARGSTGQLGFQRLERLLSVLLEKERAAHASSKDKVTPPEDEQPKRRRRATAASREKQQNSKSPSSQTFPSAIEWKVQRSRANDTWSKRLTLAEELFSPKRPEGPKTLLFDEPESGFSIPWQAGLWANCFAKVDPARFQVIVATHSPFALGIPNANYIELTPGYMDESQLAVNMWAAQILS